jgi:hypothetical protein
MLSVAWYDATSGTGTSPSREGVVMMSEDIPFDPFADDPPEVKGDNVTEPDVSKDSAPQRDSPPEDEVKSDDADPRKDEEYPNFLKGELLSLVAREDAKRLEAQRLWTPRPMPESLFDELSGFVMERG